MTAICAFSKFIILIPLRNKTAVTVAKAIMDNVFMKFGAGEILTDNGLEFRCELLNELCRLMGVAQAFTTSYQEGTNVICESNRTTVNYRQGAEIGLAKIDFQLDTEEHTPYSINDYASMLVNRLERAHELAREQLQITVSQMNDFYDKNVHAMNILISEMKFTYSPSFVSRSLS